jgi:O-antigen/teichoic acid export membrane protein
MSIPTSTIQEENPQRDAEASKLLKRTPYNYLFGQVYGLWLYLSLFLLSIIITRNSTNYTYGVFASIQTAMNTILYIVALGLEDAAVTFAPRLFAERGRASAARMIRSLLSLRTGTLLICAVVLLFGLSPLANVLRPLPMLGEGIANSLGELGAHAIPITIYVVASSVANLLNAVCAARMHMHRVLIVNGVAQLALLLLCFLALQSGWGLDGVLWMQAIAGVLSALGFALWLTPMLLARGENYVQPLKPVLRLGFSAWQTNLVTGALFKQLSIMLLSIFITSPNASFEEIGHFNLAFQLADAANVLLVSGFSGVGASALATAFVGNNYDRLGRSWQVLIKAETLLAAPGLVFCLFNAPNIATTLYGNNYAAVGPLMAIFLIFNLLTRVAGSTIHQATLYVVDQPRHVVISQWIGLVLVIGCGVLLVPLLGAAGALIADGVAKATTGILMLVFLIRKIPRRYALDLLTFSLRFLAALFLAALPGILWHPTDRLMLVVSGGVFVVLCLVLLFLIKPLSADDMEMIGNMKPKLARFLHGFARR